MVASARSSFPPDTEATERTASAGNTPALASTVTLVPFTVLDWAKAAGSPVFSVSSARSSFSGSCPVSSISSAACSLVSPTAVPTDPSSVFEADSTDTDLSAVFSAVPAFTAEVVSSSVSFCGAASTCASGPISSGPGASGKAFRSSSQFAVSAVSFDPPASSAEAFIGIILMIIITAITTANHFFAAFPCISFI